MRVVLWPASAGRKTINIMKKRKTRHSPEQIVRKIQQADRILAEGGDVAAVVRELNITEATYYRWRNHYGGPKESTPIETINLMALSSHSVIANSTFSWWGAWLGDRASRHVIHSRPWVDFKGVNDRDLHLPAWIGVGRDGEEEAERLNVVN